LRVWKATVTSVASEAGNEVGNQAVGS